MAERDGDSQRRIQLEQMNAQMFDVLRHLRRIERKLQKYRARIIELEHRVKGVTAGAPGGLC